VPRIARTEGSSPDALHLRRRKVREVDPLPAGQPEISFEEARADCQAAASSAVKKALLGGFSWMLDDTLLAHPPGIGKTHCVVEAMNSGYEAGSTRETLFVGTTHALLREVAGKLNTSCVHVQGRMEEGMCEHPEIVKDMHEKGLPMATHVCDRVCPAREACAYFEQFQRDALVWLCTPLMARSERIQFGVKDSERGQRHWSLVVFDDVNPIDAVVGKRTVGAQDVLREARFLESGPVRSLLTVLATAATAASSMTSTQLLEQLETDLGREEFGAALLALEEEPLPKDRRPDFPEDQLPTADDISDQPPVFLAEVFRALMGEGKRYTNRKGFNGRIRAGKGVLDIGTVERPDYLDEAHVLAMDATPNLPAWEHLIGRRPSIHGDEQVALPHTVSVTQVADFFSGMGTMAAAKHRAKRTRQIRQVREKHGPTALLVTFERHEAEFARLFGEDDVSVRHYWALRGINEYEGYDSVVLIGSPSPNPAALEYDASIFYAYDEPLDTSMELRPERYLTPSDHLGFEVDVLRYKDTRLDEYLLSLREGEMYQTVHRIRPLVRRNPPTSLSIIILTELPVPGLPGHVTGVHGAYCAHWDETTERVVDGAGEAFDKALDARGHLDNLEEVFVTTGDIAEAAFGSREYSKRKKQLCRKVLDRRNELKEHLGVSAVSVELGEVLVPGVKSKQRGWHFGLGV